MRTLWFLLAVPACAPSSPVARLADLPDPQIQGVENVLGIGYDTSVDCFELSPDVHGSVDGQPLSITTGGWRNTIDGNICDPIVASYTAPLAANPMTSIELADGGTTWSFRVAGLAPQAWTITSPPAVTEGSDFSVSFAPTPPGVALAWVDLSPDDPQIETFSAQPDASNTVHIGSGYWSDLDEGTPGESMPATLAVELGPLPVDGCPIARCAFSTHTPSPAQPITIVIP